MNLNSSEQVSAWIRISLVLNIKQFFRNLTKDIFPVRQFASYENCYISTFACSYFHGHPCKYRFRSSLFHVVDFWETCAFSIT